LLKHSLCLHRLQKKFEVVFVVFVASEERFVENRVVFACQGLPFTKEVNFMFGGSHALLKGLVKECPFNEFVEMGDFDVSACQHLVQTDVQVGHQVFATLLNCLKNDLLNVESHLCVVQKHTCL